jgi:hypothetical protein
VRIEETASAFQTVNFVKNQAENELIRLTALSTDIEDCAFIKDSSTAITNEYVVLRNCIFSETIDDSRFLKGYRTARCSFRAGWKTMAFEIADSAVCWMHIPADEHPVKPKRGPEKGKERDHDLDSSVPSEAVDAKKVGASVVLVVSIVVIIGVVLVFVFVAWKWWKGRDPAGALLRMYSEV